MTTATEQAIEFTAELLIEAIEGKKPQVSIVAYNGDLMEVSAGLVVVDLAGLSIPSTIPLLANHENDSRQIVGQVTATTDGQQLTAEGFVSLATGAGRDIVGLHKDGVKFQASIGARGTKFELVRPGDTVSVNGRSVTSARPFRVARTSALNEISIVAIGAGAQTSVDIAAKAKEIVMADPTTTTTKTEEEIRAEERERIQAIDSTCKPPISGWGEQQTQVDDLKAKAVAGDITAETLKGSLLSIIRETRPHVPAAHSDTRRAAGTEVLEAKMLIRCNMAELAVKEYGEDTCARADHIQASSLQEICAEALRLDGQDIGGIKSGGMIRAAFGGFSGGSVPTLMGNTINRALLSAYNEAPTTWRSFAAIRSANNFKGHTSIRPTFIGELDELPRNKSMDHASVDESTFTWSVNRFAKMLRVDEQDMIDDDLNFLQETAPAFGRAASRSLNNLVWKTIMENAGSFFSAGNNNLETGGGSALDGTSLGTVITAFRSRRDSEDVDLDIQPKVLAVPPELEIEARQLLQSLELSKTATAAGTPIGNALANSLALEVEPRMSNTAKFENASLTAWYVFGAMQDAALIVAFLNGQQTPRLRFFGTDHTVEQIGVAWTIDHDYGAALGDPVAGHKANGA